MGTAEPQAVVSDSHGLKNNPTQSLHSHHNRTPTDTTSHRTQRQAQGRNEVTAAHLCITHITHSVAMEIAW